VLSIAPRLADSPELAWAFAEARQLARSMPPAQPRSWYRRAGIAWGAAALSTIFATVLAVLYWFPSAEGTTAPALGNSATSLATILSPAEIASRVAEFAPVVLIHEAVAVDGRSLVVLPFANLPSSLEMQSAATGDTAEALYERLVRQLAAMPGIYVIEPSTAAVYADGSIPPEQIALYLGVRGVVQGRVGSDGDTISIDFRFTDAAGAGSAVDSSFERPVAEIAMLQNDIALRLLDALGETPAPFAMRP
jgi:TolB-like protein